MPQLLRDQKFLAPAVMSVLFSTWRILDSLTTCFISYNSNPEDLQEDKMTFFLQWVIRQHNEHL